MNRGTIVALLVACAGLLDESAAFAQQPQPEPPPAPPAKPPAAQKPPAKPPAPAPKPPAAAPKPAAPPAAAPKPAAPAPKPGAAPAKPPAKPNGAQPAPGEPPPGGEPPAEPPAEGTEPEEEGAEPERPPETEPGATPQPGTRPAGPGAGGLTPMPMWPAPGSDASSLEKQGDQRPAKGDEKKTDDDRVFAEDWWSHARPIFEIHGYFRLRAELFHNFSLGRIDQGPQALWPMPSDNHYNHLDGTHGPDLCTGDETVEGLTDSDDPKEGLFPCKNKTQAGANIRFRLNPELHISDNLRVMSQIDLLDNLVLGSTPEGYSNEPGIDGGYQVTTRGGYAPLGAFENTQAPPSAGINSYRDSIRVKRAWAEYMTPVGQLRFGRMPSDWGLGILANAGDGYDDDYQSTADRIMFITGIKAIDLYFVGAWDFSNEGATSDSLSLPGAQPYDLGQLDDVDQYVLAVARRKNPQLTKLALAQGDLVLNGGVYVVYRKQLLANDRGGQCADRDGARALGCPTIDNYADGFVRRGAEAWIPDLWLQVLYKKFRFELEAVTIQGSVENTLNLNSNYTSAPGGAGWSVNQWGIATELSQKLVEDRLKLEFKFGWASGDEDVYGPNTGSGGLAPGLDGLQPQPEDDTISTFRFHPNYKVDLILNRNLLTRIQGVHYFRPSVEYDFIRNPNGQRFGGGFAAIWTRATRFIQTPGHNRELGVELDFSLYFQSKDGALNDDPDKMGGFYTMLQYGVLFPLAGLDYQKGQVANIVEQFGPGSAETSTAQILRWYLGVMF